MSCADTYLTQNMIAGCLPEIEFLDNKNYFKNCRIDVKNVFLLPMRVLKESSTLIK